MTKEDWDRTVMSKKSEWDCIKESLNYVKYDQTT